MTDINVYVPANIYDFYKIIKGLSQLSFIPTDKIFELMDFQRDIISDVQNVFMDIGPFFIVLLVGFVILLVLVFLKVIFCCSENACLKKVYNKLNSYLFWTATLRYILESYIKMTLFSITLASTGFDWSSNLKRVQSVAAII
jgi:hypothetical protein